MLYKTALDLHTLPRYVRSVCERADLKLVWEEPGSIPRTNGRTMYLPRPALGQAVDSINALVGAAVHECLHVMHTDFDVYMKLAAKHSPLRNEFAKRLNNVIEDNRIEAIGTREYRGDGEVLAWSSGKLADDITKMVKQQVQHSPTMASDPMMGAFVAMIVWDALVRMKYQPSTVPLLSLNGVVTSSAVYMSRFNKHPELLNALEDLIRNENSTTGDGVMLTLEVMEKVFFDMPDEDEDGGGGNEEGEGGEGEQDGDSKDEPKDGDKEGDSNEEGKGKGKEGKGEDDKKKKHPVTVMWEDVLPKMHDMEGKNTGQPLDIDYTNYSRHGQSYVPSSSKVIDLTKGTTHEQD